MSLLSSTLTSEVITYRPEDEFEGISTIQKEETISEILESPLARQITASKIAQASKTASACKSHEVIGVIRNAGWGQLYWDDFKRLPRLTPEELRKTVMSNTLNTTADDLTAANVVPIRLVKTRTMTGDSVCIICRENVGQHCSQCEVKIDDGCDEPLGCKTLVGVCRHSYHEHCLSSWFSTAPNNKCPLCYQDWVTATEHTIED